MSRPWAFLLAWALLRLSKPRAAALLLLSLVSAAGDAAKDAAADPPANPVPTTIILYFFLFAGLTNLILNL